MTLIYVKITSMPPVNHPYLSPLATKPSKASILLRFRYDASKPSTHRNEIEDYDVLVASFDVSKASTHRKEIVDYDVLVASFDATKPSTHRKGIVTKSCRL